MGQSNKHSIRARFGAANRVIIVSALAIIAIVVIIQINMITVDLSLKYAGFHSSETAEKLNIYIAKELSLITAIADSSEIKAWFLDENNPEKKRMAFEKFSSVVGLMTSTDFCFAVGESLHSYVITKNTDLDQFLPFHLPLDPGLPEDSWYFECLREDMDYALKIDISKMIQKEQLWINCKVMSQGKVLGIVCSGLYFNEIEGNYLSIDGDEETRIIVINRDGWVQFDNTLSFIDNLSRHNILISIPGLSSVLEPYLGNSLPQAGYFDKDALSRVFRIKSHGYGYMSAFPITNTDWVILTLFKKAPLFDSTVILPLIIILVIVFILYITVQRIVFSSLILKPLSHLIESLDGESQIAGLDRKDEFGDLAKIIRDNIIRSQNEEQRAAMMLKTNPLGCMLFDDSFNFIDCNDAAISLFNLTDKEELKSNFINLSPEFQSNGKRSKDEIFRRFKTAYDNGRMSFEWMHKRQDGAQLPVEITVDRVKYGERYLLCVYLRDLRQQMAMTAEVEYQSELLHAVNDIAALLSCLETDDFSSELHVCLELLGQAVSIHRIGIWKNLYREGELLCSEILKWMEGEGNITSGDKSSLVYEKMPPLWEGPLSRGQNIKCLVKDLPENEQGQFSAQGIISFLIIPILIEDHFWGFIGFNDCRTERTFSPMEESCLQSGGLLIANAFNRAENREKLISAREEALSASRAKSNFLSNMSHEIRTPMNAIIGMTSIGKSAETVERKDYAFGKINDASSHLLGVINDILDMSKIEADKFELSPDEFDFEKMLQKTVEVINFRVEEKLQSLSVHIGKGLPRFVVGDSQRLAQVVTNLLSNAVKFTPEKGSIILNAFPVNQQEDECRIQIEVIDSGIGISKEQQAKLFNSFVQAESSTSRKFGGSGLGLVISKRIVEMMNGKIWIESEPGKGSKFVFFVQLKKGSEPLAAIVPKRENVRLLAVDDDPEALEFFAEICGRCGIVCSTAASGEEALELIGQNGVYDLYFIDWKLPGINGLELSRQIIGVSAPKKPFIVLISAFDWNSMEKEAKEAGINTFLSKPLFPSPVIDCINNYLGVEVKSAKTKNSSDEKKAVYPGRHILIADDVEINREILISILESTQMKISSATNGREAVNVYADNINKLDLIFMDIQMPEMDGYEASRNIRSLEAQQQTTHVPIIAMTANVFKEDIVKCLEAGMDSHVGKPINMEAVFEVLKKYLS